ncbi:MAG: hypothetical protein FWF97_04520, partial [Alphaproteobacteria bacterium]|nr:hypothetical protein [Alphaproteobacteria bacterium]
MLKKLAKKVIAKPKIAPKTTQNAPADDVFNKVKTWCDENNTDIFIYSGPIVSNLSASFVNEILQKTDCRKNCLLFLTSYGGEADWAYKMAAALKKRYEKYAKYLSKIYAEHCHRFIISFFANLAQPRRTLSECYTKSYLCRRKMGLFY